MSVDCMLSHTCTQSHTNKHTHTRRHTTTPPWSINIAFSTSGTSTEGRVRINTCLFSLLAVGICAYTYHVPLSLWFNSGVEHGSLSYICKILFNTWYIIHTCVIDAGPKHTYTRVHTWMLDQGMILIFPGLSSHYGGFCSICLSYFISLQISSGINFRVFPWWGL